MDIEVFIGKDIKSDDLNFDRPDKSFDQSRDEIKISNFLSSRLEFMDEEFCEQDARRSLLLLSRQYPTYRHYSKRGEKSSKFRFMNKYHILPEIRGQTLFGNERERSEDNYAKVDLNVSNFKLDTLQQLQSSILRYGSNSENVWMGFTGQKYEHKLVRPGFSARRYLANLARNLNETLVKKLMCEGYILEKNLFTSNAVMPHIRRRLSDDLSRYPEPYRILKQMLIAPGPLNEFSFVWGRTSILNDEGLLHDYHEMESGDIKILFKKNADDGNEEFEEVQYAELSSPRKKTILSNLLVKSAMNHAIRIKEQMMEYNDNVIGKTSRHHVPNIHIPVVKFDMKKAINELLTKETMQTLTTTQMELPFIEECVNDKFKGKGFQATKRIRFSHPPESDTGNEEPHHTSVFDTTSDHDITKEDRPTDGYLPQNLTIRLNQSHPSKMKRKKKVVTSDSVTGRESEASDGVAHVSINPSDNGLKSAFTIDRESQGNAFAEMIKKKAELAATRKESIQPYGKYKDPNLATIGDIDPTFSFSNWKYKEDHIHAIGTDSGHLTKTEGSTLANDNHLQSQHDHNRLVHLLRDQADSVAEEVLGRTDGGLDFASDVNVAIKSIVGQTQRSGNQIWNLEVDDLENQAEYQGVIKNIFKSIYKDELQSLGSDDIEVSPSLMALLQSGLNLKLEDIEMVTDPVTGKMMAVLKKGVRVPDDTPLTSVDLSNPLSPIFYGAPLDGSIVDGHGSVASSIYPFNVTPGAWQEVTGIKKLAQAVTKGSIPVSIPKLHPTTEIDQKNNLNIGPKEDQQEGPAHDIKSVVGDEHNFAIVRSPSGKELPLHQFVQQNNLVEENGKLYDSNGGYFTKEGQYFDKDGNSQSSKSMTIEPTVAESVSKNIRDSDLRESVLVSGFDVSGGKAVVDEKNLLTEHDYNGKIYETTIKAPDSTSEKPSTTTNNIILQPSSTVVGSVEKDTIGSSKEINQTAGKNKEGTASKSTRLSKLTTTTRKDSNKGKKIPAKDKKGKKKEFTFSRPDETKDIMKLYNRPEPSVEEATRPRKLSDNKSKKKKKGGEEKDYEQAEEEPDLNEKGREDSGDIYFTHNSEENSRASYNDGSREPVTLVDGEDIIISDEEIISGEGNEARRLKLLKRQERLAQRKAEVQRMRQEEEMKKKREEEERRLESQRLSLEDALKLKLDEERRRKEEEYMLQKEKEKEEERAMLDAERRKEYFRLRQIEKERQQREEYARRREEARIKQAFEDKLRREEQEMREREEAAMLAKLNEEERNAYLRRKAELLEQQRLEEEKERMLKEEEARQALEEAKLLAQKHAAEKRKQEEWLRMRIEDEGLKKYLKVSPAFVWSYFEILHILGVNDDHTKADIRN